MRVFDKLISVLERQNIPVGASNYDGKSMGSWYIETATNPRYRIVHDGRDQTIVLEACRNDSWFSLVADKTKSGKHALEKLLGELNAL